MGLWKLQSNQCLKLRAQSYWSVKPLFHGSWAGAIISSRTQFNGLLTYCKVVDHFSEVADDDQKKIHCLYENIRNCCLLLHHPHQQVAETHYSLKGVLPVSTTVHPKKDLSNGELKYGHCVIHERIIATTSWFIQGSRLRDKLELTSHSALYMNSLLNWSIRATLCLQTIFIHLAV